MSHAQSQALDPEAPFIAQDGLEYEDLAAYILGKPATCWRNTAIQSFRANGRSEASIREWIKGFDGEDATPTVILNRVAGLADDSISAVAAHARINRRFNAACAAAYAAEPHDDFLPF